MHAPKFIGERDTESVRQAILRLNVGQPAVNDRDFRVWQSYAARVWPTLESAQREEREGERGHRDRPRTPRDPGPPRGRGHGAGSGMQRRLSGAASRAARRSGLRGCGGRGWGGAGRRGAPERARWARMVWTARGSRTVAMTRSRCPQRGQARPSRSNTRRISPESRFAKDARAREAGGRKFDWTGRAALTPSDHSPRLCRARGIRITAMTWRVE